MAVRISRSTVTFYRAFAFPGCEDEFPAGDYEVIAEDERLQGVGFEAYRRTATYLVIRDGRGRDRARSITTRELAMALRRDRAIVDNTVESDAAPSPHEELK